MTIPVPQRINNKLSEDFYPLQKEELMALREVKLINNAAYVHLALRYENPFCDRPVQVIPKEFALRWKIPESSVYKAIAKLKELGVLNIKSGKLVVDWVIKSDNKPASIEPEAVPEAEAVNDFSDPAKNYQIQQKIIRSSKKLSDPAKNYQIRENRPPESPPNKASETPQTLQTYSDFKRSLSEGERENFFNFVRKKTENLEKPINDLEAWLASKNAAKQNRWEIYYSKYQEEKFSQNRKPTRQGNNSGSLSPSQVQRAIAEFKKQRQINQPVDESQPEETKSEPWKQQQAEINRLLDNPPEREQSLAQQRREKIAEIKRQQQELNLERKSKIAERQRQQELNEPDPEKRKAKMIRETEEFLRNRNQQNPEIGEENLENE